MNYKEKIALQVRRSVKKLGWTKEYAEGVCPYHVLRMEANAALSDAEAHEAFYAEKPTAAEIRETSRVIEEMRRDGIIIDPNRVKL